MQLVFIKKSVEFLFQINSIFFYLRTNTLFVISSEKEILSYLIKNRTLIYAIPIAIGTA